MDLKRFDHFNGLGEFFCGGCLGESWKSFGGEEDVFAVAGEHEFLFADLDTANACA